MCRVASKLFFLYRVLVLTIGLAVNTGAEKGVDVKGQRI